MDDHNMQKCVNYAQKFAKFQEMLKSEDTVVSVKKGQLYEDHACESRIQKSVPIKYATLTRFF